MTENRFAEIVVNIWRKRDEFSSLKNAFAAGAVTELEFQANCDNLRRRLKADCELLAAL